MKYYFAVKTGITMLVKLNQDMNVFITVLVMMGEIQMVTKPLISLWLTILLRAITFCR